MRAFLFRLRGMRKRNKSIHRCAHRFMHSPPGCAMMIHRPSPCQTKRPPDGRPFCLVEVRGVEPLSESILTGTSPGAGGLLRFPCLSGSRHPQRLGSFIVHGVLKALRAHVHHSSTLRPGPWYSRAERLLIKQRQEDRSCYLIYKVCPF